MQKQYKYYITSILFILLAGNIFSQKDIAPNKYLSKAVKKTWDNASVCYTALESEGEKSGISKGVAYRINDTQGSLLGYAYIGRVFSCRAGGCSIDNSPESTDNYEYFDYLILYDSSPKVELVKVFNYQATHGHEICSAGWLKQFKGYSGVNEIDYGKDIDAISGATISAISIIVDIELVSSEITTIIEKELCFINSKEQLGK